MSISIVEFYKTNKVDPEFDEKFYQKTYEGTTNFYQPFCKNNNIDDRHRLFFHWSIYGISAGNHRNAEEYKKLDPYYKAPTDYIDKKVSVVVGCMNREKMLNISIRSWLDIEPIKEIIVTDWSSENSLKYLELIDSKIKVIRIEGNDYYNASIPVNIAIKKSQYPIILKLDVDYIINPYGDFNALIDIDKGEFISGNWKDYEIDNDMGFVRGTNGFLCAYKEDIEKVGYYDESIENYGKEDCDMFKRLVDYGLKRKTLEFNPNNISIYHNPHSNYYRTENFKEKDVDCNNSIYEPIVVDQKQEEYGFVHIPKTGGTSVINFLKKNYPNYFVCSRFKNKPYHSLTTKDISNPIAIVRCPFDRFLSSYKYWKYGPANGPWVNAYRHSEKLNISIDEFIDTIQENAHIINTPLTWYAHFHPQSKWIREEDYHKTIIINYKPDLQDSIMSLIKYLNLESPDNRLEKINTSRDCNIILTDKVRDYIKEYYAKDFELIDNILSRKNIFRLVI